LERKALLKRMPIFRNLDDADIELIAGALQKETHAKGECVFRQGDVGDTMYLVGSGQVAVIGDEAQETIAFMGPGSFVGEISLLLAQPRTATLQVLIDAQLWALRKADFDRLIATRPAIALEMMRELSKRLVTTTRRKKRRGKRRRITAVFGGLGMELALAVRAELKRTIGFLPLPGAPVATDVTLGGGLMLLLSADLTEATLAEHLSYQIDVFKHVVVALSNRPDPLTQKAIDLADTVVSIGPSPDWFTAEGKKCDVWVISDTRTDLARTARRLTERTVGLALSSGGSRGVAHLGVLKVLLEENIPVDMIAGTSAGALFGALYAQGWDVEQLVGFVDELKLATRWRNWDFNIPPTRAIVKGKVARNRLINKWVDNKNFEDLKTPMFMVAADVYTGDEVVFDSGPLADAIRASLSIPILAEPWHYQGRYLLDGGIVNPLPASVLRERGADVVIGSSVIQPLAQSFRGNKDKMPHILQTVFNMYSAMEAEVVSKQLPLIDVLIQNNVSANHSLDFEQAGELIRVGEESARQMLPDIQQAIAAPVEP